MKKHTSFFAGLLTATLICLCTTGALAVSIGIMPNESEVRLGAHTLLRAKEYVTAKNGALIPSTLLVTDGKGGKNCYVPVEVFTRAMGIAAEETDNGKSVQVTLPDALLNYGLPTNMDGTTYKDVLEEIAPVSEASGKTLMEKKHFEEKEAVTTALKPVRSNRNLVSITVTNHGEKALVWGLGLQQTSGENETVKTQVPAGETVTRTVRILNMQSVINEPIFISVSGASQSDGVNATISAVQFKGSANTKT